MIKKISNATRLKMSLARKGKHYPNLSKAMSGKNHPNYGKHRTKETRLKIAKAHRGIKLTKEHCLNISKNRPDITGHYVSRSTRLKISKALTGKV